MKSEDWDGGRGEKMMLECKGYVVFERRGNTGDERTEEEGKEGNRLHLSAPSRNLSFGSVSAFFALLIHPCRDD